jgi:hypothetical protein
MHRQQHGLAVNEHPPWILRVSQPPFSEWRATWIRMHRFDSSPVPHIIPLLLMDMWMQTPTKDDAAAEQQLAAAAINATETSSAPSKTVY